jgi:type IV secretion system protein VirB4
MLPDFVPIVAHYDEASLLTKDGQLIQIIKIKGYSERFKQLDLPLDEKLRQLFNKILNKNLVIYNITKRDFTSLLSDAKYQAALAQINHELWMKENQFDNCLMNDLYLAIVHKGAKDIYNNFLLSFSKKVFIKEFFKKLEEAASQLKSLVFNILEELEPYGANLLAINSEEEEIQSEPLSFIYYLLHLKEKNCKITKSDFSKFLTLDLKIQNNYSDLSLKTFLEEELDYQGFLEKDEVGEEEAKEMVVITLNNSLQLPRDYKDLILSSDNQVLIVESFNLIDKKKYLLKLEEFLDFYEISKEDYKKKLLSELEENQAIESVTNLIIFNKNLDDLQKSVIKITELFFDLGINFIIEDYHKLSAFLAIIPGNRHLVKRQNYSTIARSCNFTQIQQKALGGYQGSKWGKALTLFKSLDNLPFFFNFQGKSGLGHSLILGPSKDNNNLLKQWLLSESVKFKGVIINFDQGLDETFTELLGGQNIAGQINLFEALEINSKEKLLQLLKIILSLEFDQEIERKILAFSDELLLAIAGKKDLNEIMKNLTFHKSLEDFFTQDYLFKNTSIEKITGFINIKKLPDPFQALLELAYLKILDKKLTKDNLDPYLVIMTSKALQLGLELIENFPLLIKSLGEKDLVILVTSSKEELKSAKMKDLMQFFPTRFFLSDKYFDKSFADFFNLNHLEVNNIKKYNPKDRVFLLKQEEFNLLSSYKILESFKKW